MSRRNHHTISSGEIISDNQNGGLKPGRLTEFYRACEERDDDEMKYLGAGIISERYWASSCARSESYRNCCCLSHLQIILSCEVFTTKVSLITNFHTRTFRIRTLSITEEQVLCSAGSSGSDIFMEGFVFINT